MDYRSSIYESIAMAFFEIAAVTSNLPSTGKAEPRGTTS